MEGEANPLLAGEYLRLTDESTSKDVFVGVHDVLVVRDSHFSTHLYVAALEEPVMVKESAADIVAAINSFHWQPAGDLEDAGA